jgi:hypothetical protein
MVGVRFGIEAPGPPGTCATHDGRMTDDTVTTVLDGLDALRSWQEDVYRDLDAHPAVPHQDRPTADNVAARLRETGCDVQEDIGGTGVVGVVRNGEGPTVLLRTDMDAFPCRRQQDCPTGATKATSVPGRGQPRPVRWRGGAITFPSSAPGAPRSSPGTVPATAHPRSRDG